MSDVQKVRGGVGGQEWVPIDKNRIAGSNPVEDPVNLRPLGADDGKIARDVELEDALCLIGNGQADDNLLEGALPQEVNADPSADNSFEFFYTKRGADTPGHTQDLDGLIATGSVKLDPRTTLRNSISAKMAQHVDSFLLDQDNRMGPDDLLKRNPFGRQMLDKQIPVGHGVKEGDEERHEDRRVKTAIEEAAEQEDDPAVANFFKKLKNPYGKRERMSEADRKEARWAKDLGLANQFTKPSTISQHDMVKIKESMDKAKREIGGYSGDDPNHLHARAGHIKPTDVKRSMEEMSANMDGDSMVAYQRGVSTLSNRNFKKLKKDAKRGVSTWLGDEVM